MIKFLVCHPNVEIPARRAAREGKPMSPAEIDEARKTVASGMGDIQAGGKGGAANKAKMEDYNKMPLKKDKGGLGFTIVGGSDTDLVRSYHLLSCQMTARLAKATSLSVAICAIWHTICFFLSFFQTFVKMQPF